MKASPPIETKSDPRNVQPRSQPLPSLDQLRHVHIVGVCGTLMGAFASFLKRRNIRVTGSDQNVYPPMSDVLREAGVVLISGYRAETFKVIGRPDIVVIGNVIGPTNVEAREAIDGGYAFCSLPEAMEQLMLKETHNCVVAGTHGKTTTSSLLAWTLVHAGKDPGYFIGGVSHDLPHSFHTPPKLRKGAFFVLEGDEYDTAFWDKVPKFNHYLPDDAILTSVEYDHADIYPDFASVRRAFDGLITRIRPGGRLIACLDYPVIGEIMRAHRGEVATYGFSAQTGARYTPGRVRQEGDWMRFDVLDNGKKVEELSLRIPGNHNVMNALAVWIECGFLGLSSSEVRVALENFQGVKRRQEVRGTVKGVTVIDDFAHHPTAVRETLRALRAKYPGRRLVAVFEPRSATSRRKVFQQEYGEAFGYADCVWIAAPYDQSRIPTDDQFSSEQLVDDLKRLGKSAQVFAEVEPGVTAVAAASTSGDVIAVLSNGGFGGFISKLLDTLAR